MSPCIYFRGGYSRRELRYFYRFEAPIIATALIVALADVNQVATVAGGLYTVTRIIAMACAYAAAPEIE